MVVIAVAISLIWSLGEGSMFDRKKLFLGFIAIFVGSTIAYGEESTGSESQSSWFVPSLTTNKHEVCDRLLGRVKETFFSEESFYNILNGKYIPLAGITPVEYGSDPDVVMEKIDYKNAWGAGYYQGTPTIMIGDKKYYLHPKRTPGCGGACEGYYLAVSDQQLPDDWDQLKTIPSSSEYKIFKDDKKHIWSFSIDNDVEFNAYQVKENGNVEKSCSIKLRPDDIANSTDDDVQKAMKVLNDFKLAVFGLTRGAGDCGSMRTHSRWTSAFASNLPTLLYRPWQYESYEDRPVSGYTHESDTYENDVAGLKDWSLMGLSEYESYQYYLTLMDKTVIDISSFYQKKFGWDKSRSNRVAKSALIAAVDSTIRFYMYEPIGSDAEREFRKAILEHHPMDEIKSINYEVKESGQDGGESLLSLAVLYPEALQYLLSKGLNPDHQNDFGKTPLIYAVQYSQLESVKMLLEAGADSNVKTTRPVNTCFYTIRTYNMTPLHYAVRYASPEIIKMLLDHGAATFIKADNQREYPPSQDTALDWLILYTNASGEEKNPNIPDAKVETVKKWVGPPNLETSQDIASKYVLEAEKLYQQKEVSRSYQILGLALELQPDNEQALSDMSLIALKNGKLGHSVEAGEKLIKNSKSEKMVANAWYNQGLACLKNGPGYLSYNGNYYCKSAPLYPFYKAITSHSTEARKKRVAELFDNHEISYCEIPDKGIKLHTYIGDNPETARYDQLQSLYVLHDTSTDISGDMLSWKVNFYKEGVKNIIPEKMGSINLGNKTLTLFGTEAPLQFPYDVMGFRCKDDKSMAVKSDSKE